LYIIIRGARKAPDLEEGIMNEQNTKRFQKTLASINWMEVHKEMVFNNSGSRIWIYEDGKISTQTSGTYPNPENEQPILILQAWGLGNIDVSYYLESWGSWDQEAEIFTTDDERKLTEEEAIIECIEDGDFLDLYDEWENLLKEEIEEEEEIEERRNNEKEYNQLY